MRYAVYLPPYEDFADARALAGLAQDAEESGWDGLFLWDVIAPEPVHPVADPWIALAAVAMVTERLRIGPMVSPLARRRPAKLAREAVSLDRLSRGRLILGVGLGEGRCQFEDLGESGEPRERAQTLDEALDVLLGLWRGESFQYAGEHIRIAHAHFVPPPLQSPRIPIWVAGAWPNRAPFRRAARWDGVVPIGRDLPFSAMLSPEDVRAVVAYTLSHRKEDGPFDIAHVGFTDGAQPVRDRETAAAYAAEGVSWWLEHIVPERLGANDKAPWPIEAMKARVRRGPPKA